VTSPVLITLAAAGGAALLAGVGVIPLLRGGRVGDAGIGGATALAGGMMLGTAFALGAVEGVEAVPTAAGAALGISFIAWTHAATGTEDLDLSRLDDPSPVYRYRVALVQALHAGSEGVAIGAAMAVSVPFGLFTAATMAVHNVPEATVLAAVQRSHGVGLPAAALSGVATNVPQVFMAVATLAVVTAAPGVLPWILGFATGALVNLVLVELLPESYRKLGHTSIALVTSVSMAMVVLLKGWVI